MSDTALHRAVMEALAYNPRVHADEIVVEVLDDSGDIVLRGTVGGLVQRAEAVRTASEVPGVRRVEDGLEVRLMGIDGRADADTEAAVLDALAADDQVHVRDVDVEVRTTPSRCRAWSRSPPSASASSASLSPFRAS
jgi:osmotically-inducible protein OsmY